MQNPESYCCACPDRFGPDCPLPRLRMRFSETFQLAAPGLVHVLPVVSPVSYLESIRSANESAEAARRSIEERAVHITKCVDLHMLSDAAEKALSPPESQ